MVESFQRHAGIERAVADHGDDFAPGIRRLRRAHAQRRRKRDSGMARAVAVEVAFVTDRESATAAEPAQRGECFPTAGQNLVTVALMADIPDDPVIGRPESAQQRYGQFDHAKVGAQMAAVGGDHPEQRGAKLGRQLNKLFLRQRREIRRAIYG
ncbi:hypothetical protein SDC9_149572 [bioreactor metagenome]|uniref:Uncharacterized protein n=1 Tax=bioreactor metagenome TaxID=1076179 RepID=A0A645ELN5_9ZZZZ